MSNRVKKCTGVILAGGENRRMPVPKAFLRVKGRRIIERNVEIMRSLFREIFIVTNDPEMYVHLGVSLLGDVYPARGPMTGILTALINSSEPWSFVTACDMPFINADLISLMAEKRDDCAAVVPRIGRRTEPLFALYSIRLIRDFERAVRTERRGLQDFLQNKKVQYITKKEIETADSGLRSFINLNTPDDFRSCLQS